MEYELEQLNKVAQEVLGSERLSRRMQLGMTEGEVVDVAVLQLARDLSEVIERLTRWVARSS